MILHCNTYGTEGFPLVILHGFLGTADNWHSLSQQFGQTHRVFVPDLRNHGRSPHRDDFSLNLMVEDVRALITGAGLARADVLGHSMGGKVAMQLALHYPELVRKLVVADIAPRQYAPGHDDVFKALFAVKLKEISSRKEAEEAMMPFVPEFGVRQFLMKNLTRDENGAFAWKMNLPVLFNQYDEVRKAIDSNAVFEKETLFLRGERSHYIKESDFTDIHLIFPGAQIKTISGAGHWLHADDPKAFFAAVEEFLSARNAGIS